MDSCLLLLNEKKSHPAVCEMYSEKQWIDLYLLTPVVTTLKLSELILVSIVFLSLVWWKVN